MATHRGVQVLFFLRRRGLQQMQMQSRLSDVSSVRFAPSAASPSSSTSRSFFSPLPVAHPDLRRSSPFSRLTSFRFFSSSAAFSASSSCGSPAALSRLSAPAFPLRRCVKTLFWLGALSGASLFAFCLAFPAEARQVPLLRCARAAWCVACICVDYKLCGNTDMSGSHARSAQRLLKLAEANRGVYIKLGQHAAAMVYLLPPAYTETLSVLQSEAPASSLEDVYSVLQKDLGVEDLAEVFEEFDPQPVGAASLAQVHFARLRDGSPVAVKVQHREVAELARADAQVVKRLEEVAERVFPEVKLRWLSELLEKNLPQEIDFLHEAANAERLRALLDKQQPLSFSLPSSSAYDAVVAPIHLFSLLASFCSRWRSASTSASSPPSSSSPSSSPPSSSPSTSPSCLLTPLSSSLSASPSPSSSRDRDDVRAQNAQSRFQGRRAASGISEAEADSPRVAHTQQESAVDVSDSTVLSQADGECEETKKGHEGGRKQDEAAGVSAESAAEQCSGLRKIEDRVQDYEIQLRVPAVYRHLSTSRVLVMERAPGVAVDDLEGLRKQRIHPLAVSHALNHLFEVLIFREGFVHADPHPGNILVHLESDHGEAHEQGRRENRHERKENRLSSLSSCSLSSSLSSSSSSYCSPSCSSSSPPSSSGSSSSLPCSSSSLSCSPSSSASSASSSSRSTWGLGGSANSGKRRRKALTLFVLDNGLYCELSKEFREHYARLWLGVLRGDRRETDVCCRFFGVEQLAGLLQIMLTLRSEASLKGGICRSRKSVEEDKQLRDSFPEFFARITEVLQSVPREFVLVIKTNDLLRAIQKKLGLDERLALLPVAHGSLVVATECMLASSSKMSFLRRWWILLRLKVTLWGLSLAERLLARRALHELQETDKTKNGEASEGSTNSALDALSGVILSLV
ncbi:ABC1 family protein [Toxoplasma gondii CAST]|uniref:ABC1 family protein n=1 Tax=Toxoplasma gondii CAST TaxID=943122 RepID=A0A425I3L5_TOXGO|nr:ABC1 family protein [Toxoplasma gondii CAST]